MMSKRTIQPSGVLSAMKEVNYFYFPYLLIIFLVCYLLDSLAVVGWFKYVDKEIVIFIVVFSGIFALTYKI